jgi:sugar phosphate isomerase/epimerase
VNFDPSHLFPAAEMIHVGIYRLEGRIVHCHFSDNDGLTNVHWRPGKGKIDWAKSFVALKDTGFDGTVSLELEDIAGVARGEKKVPGVFSGIIDATDEFIEEYKIGLEYLSDLATKAGFTVE